LKQKFYDFMKLYEYQDEIWKEISPRAT
jgi:hypothetical protein